MITSTEIFTPFWTKEKVIEGFRRTLLARLLDDKMSKLVRQNKGGSFHLYTAGHELVGVMCGLSLESGRDWGLPYYRDRAFAIGFGASIKDLLAAFLARDIPHHSGGRQMPDHFSHKGLNIPCQSSVVGSQLIQAAGVAKAESLLGKNSLVYVSIGEGGTSQGDFHEALNFAAIHKLNVVFVVQDNGWAISVPKSEQTAGGSILPIARGYTGLEVIDVDGTDVAALMEALEKTVERGRSRQGPTLISARVPRIGAHSSSDNPSKYKTEEMMQSDMARDPLVKFENWLIENDVLTSAQIEQLRHELIEEVNAQTVEAEKEPFPDVSSAEKHIFAPTKVQEIEAETFGDVVTMVDAINHALHEEMAINPHLVVFGQDVARDKGGVFGVTAGLTAKFGKDRCFNSTLAESTIVGVATGMSFVEPFTPVFEVQFADYIWTGVNQLFNELASMHYRSNGEWNCPVVLRMPCGGYIQGGPYHSQSIEAFLSHVPGLKVVMPSNAEDAKTLLKAAIRDPGPVVFLEHKGLYRQHVYAARKEPDHQAVTPLGKGRIHREGADVTLVVWGMLAHMGNEVALELAKEGISVEVIDPRTLVPFDEEMVLDSVKKTGKLLIAHEAPLNCGFGAEIAARMAEKGFEYLDAPIRRLGGKNVPVPYNKELESAVLPQTKDLKEALRSLAAY